MSSAVLANPGTSHRTFPQNIVYRNIVKRESARRNAVVYIFGFILFALQLKIVSTSFCIAEYGEPHCARMRTFQVVRRQLALTYEVP
jgi:hypothetical protein